MDILESPRDTHALLHTSGTSSMPSNGTSGTIAAPVALCASCDRCRTRKTKCDGARPCSNCATKYMKKNKLESIEGIPLSEFDCVYSPAKRRGPVPGKSAHAGSARKADAISRPSVVTSNGTSMNPNGSAMGQNHLNAINGNVMNDLGFIGSMDVAGTAGFGGFVDAVSEKDILLQQLKLQQQQLLLQQQQQLLQQTSNNMRMDQNQLGSFGLHGSSNIFLGANSLGDMSAANTSDMMNLMQRQQQLQNQQQQQQTLMGNSGISSLTGPGTTGGFNGAGETNIGFDLPNVQAAAAAQEQLKLLQMREMKQKEDQLKQQQAEYDSLFLVSNVSAADDAEKIDENGRRTQRLRGEWKEEPKMSKSKLMHLDLLESSSVQGKRLRSYYDLSINELLNLPPVPTDEEFCKNLPVPLVSHELLPQYDAMALKAARYAELALGAFVSNQMNLALELANATVSCLRDCVEEPLNPMCMFDVARAYFLLGVFRSYRGDLERYLKYRRVCLTHLHRMQKTPGIESLLAAISFHDSWAYITHNANKNALPDIDHSIPPLPCSREKAKDLKAKLKLGITDTEASVIACNPDNQLWIQGPPPIFINNEAPPISRSLDALACAVRTCCDQANRQFDSMSPDNKEECLLATPTASAVLSNEKELCSRNMVTSAHTLLQQHESSCKLSDRHVGHHMIISAMDAFLGDHDMGSDGAGEGFSDSQVQNLLHVCNAVVDHPYVLHQPGPIYHMVTNAAVLIVHLLNGMHSNLLSQNPGHGHSQGSAQNQSDETDDHHGKKHEMERMLFDETLDTFISVRKILVSHRRKLPAKLRCHSIPRPRSLAFNAYEVDKEGNGKPFIDLDETLLCGCRGCQGFVLMACSPCVAAERAQAARERQEAEIQAERDLFADGRREGRGENSYEDGEILNEFDKELNALGAEFDMDDDALLGVLSRIIQS